MKHKFLILLVTLFVVACSKPPGDDATKKQTGASAGGAAKGADSATKPTDVAAQTQPSAEELLLAAEKQVDEKIAAFNSQMTEFRASISQAKTDEERNALFAKAPNPEAVSKELLDLAKANPKSPVALKALKWVAANARQMPAGDEANRIFMEDFIDSLEIGDMVGMLAFAKPSLDIEQSLQKVIDASPHDVVKGKATMALARYLTNVPNMKDYLNSANPDEAKQLSDFLGESGVAYVKNFPDDTQRVEALYESIVTNYPDLESRPGIKMATAANAALFEIRNLGIGKIAPDIEGKDLDDVAFKLNDYRGKVVMIDFWGDW